MRISAVGAAAAVACVALALIGCTGSGSGGDGDLRARVDGLAASAGTTQLGAVTLRDGVVTIAYADDAGDWSLSESHDAAELAPWPTVRQQVPVDELPVDDLTRALDVVADDCRDGTPHGQLESTATGALLMSVACLDDSGTAIAVTTWLDGEELPEFERWTSAEALQTVLDEAVAMLGADLVEVDVVNEGSFQTSSAGSVSIVAAHEVDGEVCETYPTRWRSADALAATVSTSLFVYGICLTPSGLPSGDPAQLTGARVVEAVEQLVPIDEVSSFRLRVADDGAADDGAAEDASSWEVTVFDFEGRVLGTEKIA